MQRSFIIFLLLVLIAAGAAGFALVYDVSPNSNTQATTLIIRKGTPSPAIAQSLAGSGIIRYPYVFLALHYATGETRQFKAGEYVFEAGITPKDVARKLVAGDVVVHKITIPEGYNVREVKELLAAESVLEGDVPADVAEGSLLPETYHFTYGDTRAAVIKRMQTAMQEVLADSWSKRTEGLPFKSPQEALILASIVEKETGVESERARVAAVFINRLNRGMRLQTDPSVVYGIEQQTGTKMEQSLTYADLEKPTPYNTYVIDGLPPTPIANPGMEAIRAVMQPLKTDELYFVATGNGGHNFAKTLDEHNRNVAAYRKALQ